MPATAPSTALKAYNRARGAALSPQERILYVLDTALQAIESADTARVHKALALLRQSLDYDAAPEIALGLERLYAYCDRTLDQGERDEARRVLRSLRSFWQGPNEVTRPPFSLSTHV